MNFPTLVVLINKLKEEINRTSDSPTGEVILSLGEAKMLLPILEREHYQWVQTLEDTGGY